MMQPVVVILGPTVTNAARAAVSLAVCRFDGDWAAHCAGVATGCYAVAAGAQLIDAVDHINIALVAFDDKEAAVLAETHSAALVLDVIEIMTASPLRVARNLGRGEREILDISGAAVLALSDEAPNERYISRHRRASVLPPLQLGESRDQGDREGESSYSWQPVRPRTQTPHLAERTAGSATHRAHMLFGVGETKTDDTTHLVTTDCAQHLLRYLSHYGLVDWQVTAELPVSSPTAPALVTDDPTSARTVPSRTARGSRPFKAPAHSLDRLPAPYSPTRHRLSKLSRSPRPIDTPP